MKTASPALIALLASPSREWWQADLYTITIVGGGILRYCSGDADITANGFLFSAGGVTGPLFELDGSRPLAHWKAGLDVDQMTLDVIPKNATINGVTFQAAIKNGLFDAAEFTCERAYMPTYGNTAAGTVIIFVGRVGQVSPVGRTKATFNINSHLELLNINLPRNLYTASCVNQLGDAACTVNLALFAVTGAIAAGSTANMINALLVQASGYFSYGKIVMTSGANVGLSRSIRTYNQGSVSTVDLLGPFPQVPALGDTFTIYPGCDKAMGTCFGKFSNLANYRGQPFIPENSTAV